MSVSKKIEFNKKLVSFCRKSGVLTFKTAEFEFTLSPELPEKTTLRRSKNKLEKEFSEFIKKEDELYSEEDALFWSSAGLPEESTEGAH